jgi:hypothetical protein
MSVIRVGSSGQYAAGWDAIFGGGKAKAAGGTKRAKKAAKKAAKVAGSGKKPAAVRKAKNRRRK